MFFFVFLDTFNETERDNQTEWNFAMSDSWPGPLYAVHLISGKKRNLDFCIIFQHVKDSQGNRKLFGTCDGRETIQKIFHILHDGILNGLSKEDIKKYHLKLCCRNYTRKGKKQFAKQKAYKHSAGATCKFLN